LSSVPFSTQFPSLKPEADRPAIERREILNGVASTQGNSILFEKRSPALNSIENGEPDTIYIAQKVGNHAVAGTKKDSKWQDRLNAVVMDKASYAEKVVNFYKKKAKKSGISKDVQIQAYSALAAAKAEKWKADEAEASGILKKHGF
jgi:hypothetical protein